MSSLSAARVPMKPDWFCRWFGELASTKSCCPKSKPPKLTSARRCSAAIHGCSARSRSGRASRPASAVWFINFFFSTFSGRSRYLSGRPVRASAHRGKGIGKALLADLASECVTNGWSQLQWAVLDWNTPSIEFYKSLGAVLMDEWTGCRIGGPALTALAREGFDGGSSSLSRSPTMA